MPGPQLLTQKDVDENFAPEGILQQAAKTPVRLVRPPLFLIVGGRYKDPPRPLFRMAKVVGWIALGLFALALLSNCAPKPGGSCCLQGHEEPDTWSWPMDVGNDTIIFIPMDGTRFVCDARGARDDAGVCQ